MTHGVTVALQILVLSVKVRILMGQRRSSENRAFFMPRTLVRTPTKPIYSLLRNENKLRFVGMLTSREPMVKEETEVRRLRQHPYGSTKKRLPRWKASFLLSESNSLSSFRPPSSDNGSHNHKQYESVESIHH